MESVLSGVVPVTLIRETHCEHYDPEVNSYPEIVDLELNGSGRLRCFSGSCPGGSRTEVTIDYDAFHQALVDWYDNGSMTAAGEKKLVDAALGIKAEKEQSGLRR